MFRKNKNKIFFESFFLKALFIKNKGLPLYLIEIMFIEMFKDIWLRPAAVYSRPFGVDKPGNRDKAALLCSTVRGGSQELE